MVFSSSVVIRGFLGTNPKRFDANGTEGISFRLASSRSYFDRKNQQWRDSPTTWITVRAFRGLAHNISRSLTKGDPVVVAGELMTDEWVQEGVRRSAAALQASVVGHDLNQGSSNFIRSRTSQSEMQHNDQTGTTSDKSVSSSETPVTEPAVSEISAASARVSASAAEFSGFADESFTASEEAEDSSGIARDYPQEESVEKRELAYA